MGRTISYCCYVLTAICLMGTLRAEEPAFVAERDFVSLFDGKSLAGWTGSLAGYAVEDGNLVCLAGGTGNLLTEKDYADFILKFEFKLTPGANNGLGIRCPNVAEGNLHLDGIELQILDDTAEKYQSLKPYQYHGSVYGLVPAKQGALKPVGEWNQQVVTVQGQSIKVVLNGTTIVDADLNEATKTGTLDGQPHPGLLRGRGRIALLGHGDRVDFRRLQINERPVVATTDALDVVKQRLADKQAILLDVRETSEWNESHLNGAISLPISMLQNGIDDQSLEKIVSKEKTIYAYCGAGGRSLIAANKLSKRGYDVRPLKPGFQQLVGAGFPQSK